MFVAQPKREASLWALDSYNTGLQALDLNHLDVAQRKLDLAYAYVPDNAELNFALGNLRLAQGQRKQQSRFISPRCVSIRSTKVATITSAFWPSRKTMDKLAANLFRKALEQNPRDAKTYYLLSRAHVQAGDLGTARNEIDQAIKLDPTRAEFIAFKETLKHGRPSVGRSGYQSC